MLISKVNELDSFSFPHIKKLRRLHLINSVQHLQFFKFLKHVKRGDNANPFHKANITLVPKTSQEDQDIVSITYEYQNTNFSRGWSEYSG